MERIAKHYEIIYGFLQSLRSQNNANDRHISALIVTYLESKGAV